MAIRGGVAGHQITCTQHFQGRGVLAVRSSQDPQVQEIYQPGLVCGSWRDGDQQGVKVRFDADGVIQDIPFGYFEIGPNGKS